MRTTHLLTGIALLAMCMTSCDNISEDNRYNKVEKPVIDNPRTLLIMEFTGNKCLNCPVGASIVEGIIEEETPGRVISVGLHPYGNDFTNPVISNYPVKHMQDFRTEAATALYDYYKPSGMPSAVFNGLKSSLSGSTAEWNQKASTALEASSVINLSAGCKYEPETRLLTVTYDAEFLDYVDKKLCATVWLMENKIMGTQTMPDGKQNKDYEHNHVLRASLNGNWGEDLGSYFREGEIKQGTASMTLDDSWVAENCEVVVYVYNDDNKEVEQATSVRIEN